MGIFETFSKRQKKLSSSGQKDVYQYDTLPAALRVQLVNIFSAALSDVENTWHTVHDILAHELGRFVLAEGTSLKQRCRNLLLKSESIHECLDLIELLCRAIHIRAQGYEKRGAAWGQEKKQQEDFLEEVNFRFRENGLGYQFASGQLIRVDSQFVHAEVVKPALALLHEAEFHGATEEFLKSHEHYRAGRYSEAIAAASNAFESTMKSICDTRKWPYAPNATSKALIGIVVQNGLIPSELQSEFSALRSVLESGLPTIRNRAGGHGQGKDPVPIPPHLASYALHLAAVNILFLVQSHKALP